MSRYVKLDQNRLLDAAEQVILKQGSHALTIGNVATEAGVSRGGIQSNFGSKEKLISALLKRWTTELEQEISALENSGENSSDLYTFLKASRIFHLANPKRNKAMMIFITHSDEYRSWACSWIAERMNSIDPSTPQGRQQRLKFMIVESLLAVKSIGLVSLTDSHWEELFEDLDQLLKM